MDLQIPSHKSRQPKLPLCIPAYNRSVSSKTPLTVKVRELNEAVREARQLIEESKKVLEKADKVLRQSPIITGYDHESSERSKRKTERSEKQEDSS
jgi:hypothetical protein